MEDPRLTPPPLPSSPEEKKPSNTSAALIIGCILVGLFLLSLVNGGIPEDRIDNSGYIAGYLTVKLLIYGSGAYLALRGLKQTNIIKPAVHMILCAIANIFVTIYLGAFAFVMMSQREDEGIISSMPIINITKIIALITLGFAMYFIIKGIRLINPDK